LWNVRRGRDRGGANAAHGQQKPLGKESDPHKKHLSKNNSLSWFDGNSPFVYNGLRGEVPQGGKAGWSTVQGAARSSSRGTAATRCVTPFQIPISGERDDQAAVDDHGRH